MHMDFVRTSLEGCTIVLNNSRNACGQSVEQWGSVADLAKMHDRSLIIPLDSSISRVRLTKCVDLMIHGAPYMYM